MTAATPASDIARRGIFRLVYCSTMTIPGDDQAISHKIVDIVQWSRDWNRMADISGALLVDSESFSQVLEGPANAVKGLFGHIMFDKRHRDVTLLEAGFVDARAFPEWSMAYVGSAKESDIQVSPDQIGVASGIASERAGAIINLLQYVMQEKKAAR